MIVIPALAVVLSHNLFHAGLCLIVSFLGISALYVTLSTPFMAGVQVIVYAGAIAVVLLFAFMLTHDLMRPQLAVSKLQQTSAATVTVLLALVMGRVLLSSRWEVFNHSRQEEWSLVSLAESLLTEHLISFELISLLLTIALIGAVVIARKEAKESPLALVEKDRVAVAEGEQS